MTVPDWVVEALDGQSAWTFAAALAISLVYGAAHGLSPGHGKSMMAAYLIGREGRPRDATILGVTVTLAHMGGVFVLGVVMALALGLGGGDETLLWWLRTLSGLAVLVVGMILLISRVRRGEAACFGHSHEYGHPHHHGHHHVHDRVLGEGSGHVALDPPATPTAEHSPRGGSGRRGLPVWQTMSLGLAGGAVPCPSAIAMVGIGTSLGRPVATLALVFAFSLGLAGSLVLLGLGIVRGSRWLERVGVGKRAIRAAGIAGAVVLVLVGVALTAAPTLDHGWLGGGGHG
jgi:ABC-type nickel/cobalt efflux system permease component RcnA